MWKSWAEIGSLIAILYKYEIHKLALVRKTAEMDYITYRNKLFLRQRYFMVTLVNPDKEKTRIF